MREFLGMLILGGAVGFEIGLFYTNARFSWFGLYDHAWAGFFGFGIPMFLLAGGVGVLWEKMPAKLRFFAWVCISSGLVWAVGLFITVSRWVGLVPIGVQSPVGFWEGLGSFVAFALLMLVTGVTGIGILLEHGNTDRE